MKNKIMEITELKVLKLSRMTGKFFNAVVEKVQAGIEVPVTLVQGDKDRIVVSYQELSGVVSNDVVFGALDRDNNDAAKFEEVGKLIQGNYSAKAYALEGMALLVNVKEQVKTVALTEVDSESEEERIKEFLGEDGLNDRIDALKKHGIDKGSLLYNRILSLIKPSDEELPKPKEYKHLNKKDESPVLKLLRCLAVGNHPILEGEKSLGKNVAWSYVAWILNAKIVPLQCHERLTQADILGYLSSDMTNKNKMNEEGLKAKLEAVKSGVWTDEAVAYQSALDKCNSPDLVFTKGPLTEALIRANKGLGTILLLDEMNLADGNIISGTFNMVTDGSSDHIYVTGMGNIPLPKEDLFIGATQNPPTGNYTGINQQNTATQSRFVGIIMPTVPSIAPVLKREADKWNVPELIIDNMNVVYSKFKAMALDGEDSISTDSLNIRGFESAIRLCGLGCSAREAITEGVINTVSDLEERITLTELLDNFVDEKGNFK